MMHLSTQPDELRLSTDQFDALWDAVNKTRPSSKTVTVNIEALRCLLMDHSQLLKEARK
jgi:hypothetical protein